MDNLLKGLQELIDKDQQALRDLKGLAVSHQQYEFASDLRQIEKSRYPDREGDKEMIEESEDFRKVLALANLKVDDKIAFITLHVAGKFIEMGSDVDLKTITNVVGESERIFGGDKQ